MTILWWTAGAGAIEPTGSSRGRPEQDWPAFLGSTGDAVSRETGILTDWSEGLPLVWQRTLGEGYSMGSLSDGRFFLPPYAGAGSVHSHSRHFNIHAPHCSHCVQWVPARQFGLAEYTPAGGLHDGGVGQSANGLLAVCRGILSGT